MEVDSVNKDPDLVLDPKHGIGLEWQNDDGEVLYASMPSHATFEGRRVCRLRLSSIVGIDAEAMHYYATLKPANPYVRMRGKLHSTFHGYLGKNGPAQGDIYLSSLTVMRTLRVMEKDARGRALCKVGDKTSRFNNHWSARAAAVRLFLTRFPPGWVLLEEDEYDIPAERKPLAISKEKTA